MKPLKIAVEYERGLHDARDFTVANVAPKFLCHPLNKDEKRETEYFVEEGTIHQTEFNSLPTSSLDELCRDFLQAEKISDCISAGLGVINIPISETGAGLAKINPAAMHRVHGYQTIFGKKAVQKLIRISGIHIHVDQYLKRLADQFNALNALRPTIAFTSTSSISHEGKNSVNCHRYIIIADPVDGVFAAIPEKIGYISSMEELVARDLERHDQWIQAFQGNRPFNIELPLKYTVNSFKEHFQRENTGYPDVRCRPDIGQGTYELRINDTAPLDIVLAQAGLVLGYLNNILLGRIPVAVAEKDETYLFDKTKVILPNIATLGHYAALATKHGLENSEVRKYLSAIAKFAQEGLPSEQQHYLTPHLDMLTSGENIASQLLSYLGHKETYSTEERAIANKFVWTRHRQSINHLQGKTGYQRGSLTCAE